MKLSCQTKIMFIYATQASEDPTMTLARARVAHATMCNKPDCPAKGEKEAPHERTDY